MITVRSLTLDVGDTVELDESRYVVDGIRSVVVGKHRDTVAVYDLEAVDPDKDTLRSRSVSEPYITHRLDDGSAVISTGHRRIRRRITDSARRLLGQ